MDNGIRLIARRLRLIVFDFDGVFTDNRVWVFEDGREAVACNRSDGLGLEAVKKTDVQLLVLSKERNPVVGARCRKLDIPYIQGCDDKPAALRAEVSKRQISLDDVAYVGNDVNDLGCMELVGLPVCVADAYPSVLARAKFVTERRGGDAAVREFCDFVLNARR
jgi:YrbI family 3-deoxy-D-manno-octulosonate 8-phosphate phosphatase